MTECVRCGTSNDILFHDFTYDLLPVISKSMLWYGGYNRYKKRIIESLHSIPIPVCKSCKKLFDKWLLIEKAIYIVGIIDIFFLLGFGASFSIMTAAAIATERAVPSVSFQWILPPLIFTINISICLISLIGVVIWYFIHKQNDQNPRKFIRISTGGTPYVRPHNNPLWKDYNDWVSSLEEKSEIPDKIMVQNSDSFSKYEKIIYQLLREDSQKAYTIRAIMNRIISRVPNESEKQFIKDNCEEILNQMSLKQKIKVVIKQGEVYYLFG